MPARPTAFFCIFLTTFVAKADNGVIARVNGTEIRQSQVEQAVQSLVSQGQKDTLDLRSRIKDELIARELVVQEAMREGLDQQAEIREQIDLARANILINSFLQRRFEKQSSRNISKEQWSSELVKVLRQQARVEITDSTGKLKIESIRSPVGPDLERADAVEAEAHAMPPKGVDLAKESCKSLGFKPGTPKFGNCVLEMTK